jgi:hypothetical protein
MQLTEDQAQKVQQEFARRRKRQLIATVPTVILILPMLLARDSNKDFLGIPMEACLVGGLLAIGAALIFAFKNWRCPSCDKYLGKGISPKFCGGCGVKLAG